MALPDADYIAACEGGSAVACLAAGLQLVGDGSDSKAAPIPDAAALERTLGKACDQRVYIACHAYAFRLADRPIGEQAQYAKSNAILEPACTAGNANACWLMDFSQEVAAGDFTNRRKQAEQACKSGRTGPCKTLYGLYASQIGAAPWVLDDAIAAAVLLRRCQNDDFWACDAVGQTIRGHAHYMDSQTLPYRFAAYTAAAHGCSGGLGRACRVAIHNAGLWFPQKRDELVEQVCKHVPSGCPR